MKFQTFFICSGCAVFLMDGAVASASSPEDFRAVTAENCRDESAAPHAGRTKCVSRNHPTEKENQSTRDAFPVGRGETPRPPTGSTTTASGSGAESPANRSAGTGSSGDKPTGVVDRLVSYVREHPGSGLTDYVKSAGVAGQDKIQATEKILRAELAKDGFNEKSVDTLAKGDTQLHESLTKIARDMAGTNSAPESAASTAPGPAPTTSAAAEATPAAKSEAPAAPSSVAADAGAAPPKLADSAGSHDAGAAAKADPSAVAEAGTPPAAPPQSIDPAPFKEIREGSNQPREDYQVKYGSGSLVRDETGKYFYESSAGTRTPLADWERINPLQADGANSLVENMSKWDSTAKTVESDIAAFKENPANSSAVFDSYAREFVINESQGGKDLAPLNLPDGSHYSITKGSVNGEYHLALTDSQGKAVGEANFHQDPYAPATTNEAALKQGIADLAGNRDSNGVSNYLENKLGPDSSNSGRFENTTGSGTVAGYHIETIQDDGRMSVTVTDASGATVREGSVVNQGEIKSLIGDLSKPQGADANRAPASSPAAATGQPQAASPGSAPAAAPGPASAPPAPASANAGSGDTPAAPAQPAPAGGVAAAPAAP